MKRNLVLVNLTLLGIAILLVYAFAGKWRQFEAEHRLDLPNPGPRAAAVDSEGPASPASASGFTAIVDHHLFNPDRSNHVPQELSDEPQEVLRPAPVLKGTMGLGGEDVALMLPGGSRRSGSLYRRLKVGEALDGYTLVRVEADRVVMKAGTREVKIGMDDRSGKPKRTARTAGPARPAQTARPRTTAVGSGSSSKDRRQGAARRQSARPKRTPLPKTWEVPVGTVMDGKRLIEEQTPFGAIRTWIEDKVEDKSK